MADKNSRVKDNVPGKFYVDDSCIACSACCVEASKFFEMNDLDGHAFVKLQPKTPEEIQEAENALAVCPVDAIGNNG